MDRRTPQREQAPAPHRREQPPPSLRSAPETPVKHRGGAPPFNRLQLAAALLEYEDEGEPAQDGSAGAHDGVVPPTRVVKRAADSAIFTPYRSAPQQLDYFSDLVLPRTEAESEERKQSGSRASLGSSGFGLAATSATNAGQSLAEAQLEKEPEVQEPVAEEEDEVETLAEWGLDGLLGQLGKGLPERTRKPSKARSTAAHLDLHGRQTDEDSTGPDTLPPPSPASATHSLPDRLDRRIFRPPSSASHPLLKGHAVLATRTPGGHLGVSDANDRRRAQSFDAIQRPTDVSTPNRSPIAPSPSSPRPRRVTMLDRPHAATSLDLPRPQKRSFPARARPRAAKSSADSSGTLGRTSMDIAERYRQSIAMLTEPMELGTEAGLASADFRVPLPSEYTSRFDPKVAELMQQHKDRDAELNAQPRQTVPHVLVEGDPDDLGGPPDHGKPVYDEQDRIRFPRSLNPKVLIMPAPLTPPELEQLEEPHPPEEEVQASPPKIERPAGKLYGRSLIDELRERKAAQRSRQRAYAGDDRPRMFSNSCSANNLSLVGDGSNTVAFPTSRSAQTLAAAGGGPSAAVAHARSLYAAAAMTSSRAQASVFGVDLLMQRELAKVARMEAEEAAEREERRKAEEERERVASLKKRGKGKNKGKKAVKPAEEPAATDDDWHEAAEGPVEILDATSSMLAAPIVSERAPSLDLPITLARRGSVNLDRLFDGDGSSSSDDDGFSDANSIARRLEAKSPVPTHMPALRHSSSSNVASVQRAQSVLSHAGHLAPEEEDEDEGSSEEEPLSSLVQKRKAERELPAFGDFGVQGGFGVLYAQPEGPAARSDAGTDSDDEPLGVRVSVRVASPARADDSDDEDEPLAVRRSVLSMHALASPGRGVGPGLTPARRRPSAIVPSVASDLGQAVNPSQGQNATGGGSAKLSPSASTSQPVSPKVPSALSSPAVRVAARRGTLEALEGNAVIDEDADDEVPLGYNMAMLDRRRPSTRTLPTVVDDDDDDRPLALKNPMAMATRQVDESRTMIFLMQQQNAAFASAAMTPYGAALAPHGGLPFPSVPLSSAGSATFATHDRPFDIYQPPHTRDSIARWRVAVEGEPATAST